jgi:hypothetical protein
LEKFLSIKKRLGRRTGGSSGDEEEARMAVQLQTAEGKIKKYETVEAVYTGGEYNGSSLNHVGKLNSSFPVLR